MSSKSTPVKPKAKRSRARSTADTTTRATIEDVITQEAHREDDTGDAQYRERERQQDDRRYGEQEREPVDAILLLSPAQSEVADVFAPRPLLLGEGPLVFEDASELPIDIGDSDNRWPHSASPAAGPLLRLIESCWPSTLRHRAWLVRKTLLKELLVHRQAIIRLNCPTSVNAVLRHTTLVASLGLTFMNMNDRPHATEYGVNTTAASQLSRIAAAFVLERLATMEAALVSILKTLYWAHVVDDGPWSVSDDLFGALGLSPDEDFNDVVLCVLAGYVVARRALKRFLSEWYITFLPQQRVGAVGHTSRHPRIRSAARDVRARSRAHVISGALSRGPLDPAVACFL